VFGEGSMARLFYSFRLMGPGQKFRIERTMSSDNIQHQIEFILEHRAKFSQDIEQLKEAQVSAD